MGGCTCLQTNLFINNIDSLTSKMLKQTNFSTLQIMLTKNFTIYEKEASLFNEIKGEILNLNSKNNFIYEDIVQHFDSNKNNKINCYYLLLFFFTLADHDDIALDFYTMVMHYDKEVNYKKSVLQRENVFKVLHKIIYCHTNLILQLTECNKVNRDAYDHYSNIFKEENIESYVQHILNSWDIRLRGKDAIQIIHDRIHYFTLDNIRECFKDYGEIINQEKYLIYDFERFVETNIG